MFLTLNIHVPCISVSASLMAIYGLSNVLSIATTLSSKHKHELQEAMERCAFEASPTGAVVVVKDNNFYLFSFQDTFIDFMSVFLYKCKWLP